jgi:hypothetical protein
LNNNKLIAKEIDENIDLTLEYDKETIKIEIENENVTEIKNEFSLSNINIFNKERYNNDEKNIQDNLKMGFCATLFTFIKLNLVTGFLFLPAGFLNGGWFFSIIVLAIIMCLNAYTMIDVCECSEKVNSYSLSKIGYVSMGKCGYYFCEFSIAFVQVIIYLLLYLYLYLLL